MNNFLKLRKEYTSVEDSDASGEEEDSEVDDDREVNSDAISNNNDEPQSVPSNFDRSEMLRDLLEKNANTRAIVIYYDKHNYLNKVLRNRLARFIITMEKDKRLRAVEVGELMPAFTITKDQFLFFTSEICKTFPREHPHTYYTPYTCENGVVVQTSGKLFWNYDYAKSVLFADGILSSRGTKTNVVENNVVVPASTAKKLELLKTTQRPREKVIQLWDETYEARRDDLMKNQLSVRTYIDQFSCLRMKDALLLFRKDFTRLHGKSVGRLVKFWRVAEDHLIEKIKLLKIREENFRQLINLLPSSNPDQKTCLVLSLLPYLITPRREGKKRKSLDTEAATGETPVQPQKLSFDERTKAFFIHIPNVVELEVILETGVNHTERYSLQHQPVPIIVGPFDNISVCYVILEDTIYEAESLLHAFENIIEICYAVNCEYPQNARTLWIFLQQAFLNIAHASDKPSLEVTSIIGEVQDIIYQSDLQNYQQ